MNLKLEKYSSVGAIVAAAACPICFPKLALIGALIGFGALAQYEVYFFVASQVLVLISLIGVFLAFRIHKIFKIALLATVSVVLFFTSLYLVISEYLSYFALAGLVAAIIWQLNEAKKCNNLAKARSIDA